MQGMQSNVPVSAGAASLANAILTAVQAWHEAATLSETDLQEARDAKEAIAEAKVAHNHLNDREAGLAAKEAELHKEREELDMAQIKLRNDSAALLETQRMLDHDRNNLDEDKASHEEHKKSLSTEWQKLLDEQEQLRIDRADVTRREQALQSVAAALGTGVGKAA